MNIFESNTELITKPYETLEFEIQEIINEYIWAINPKVDTLDNLTNLIVQLRIELHKEFGSKKGDAK
jgi:hypothetical protein